MADPATDQAIQQIRGGAQAQEYDKLNPAVQTGNQESFLNYSKLSNLPNITGDLFKELGETVKAGVTGMDSFFKERIRGEATAQVDNERDRTTNWLQGGDAPENLKSSVNANRTLVNNLQTAANQGQISQAYYQMRLDTIARDLRSRYPGYREHIDNVIADLTGGTPANKVITDLFHAQSGKGDAETRLAEHLSKEIIDKMPGGADYLADYRQKNGTNPSNNEMMIKYGQWQTNQLARKTLSENVKLEQELGKADEAEVGRAATQSMRGNIANDMHANGSVFSKFNTLLEDAAKSLGPEGSGTLSPKQHAALSQAATAMEAKLMNHAEATIQEFSKAAGTYGKGNLTTEYAEKLRKEAKEMSELIKSGLGAEGKILPGYLGAVKSQLDAMSNFNQYEMIRKYPLIASVSAGRHLIGDNTMASALLLSKNGEALGTVIKNSADWINASMAAGQDHNGEPATPLKIFPKIQDIAPDNPKKQGLILKDGIDAAHKTILDPNAKDVSKTVMSLYNDEFLSKINIKGADREKLYAQLSSPETTNRMLELKKQGKPELFDKYSDWVYQTGSVLARPEIQATVGVNERNTQAKIEFDPKTFTFSSAPKPGATPTNMPYNEKQLMDSTVQNLNRTLAPIIGTLKAQGLSPDAINAKLQETLNAANFNLDDITKQEGTDPNVAEIMRRSPSYRPLETGREGLFGAGMNKMHEEAAKVPPFSEGTLTREDVGARPINTNDFHIANVGGKFVVVPNLLKTPVEIKKYLEDKESPAYGIKFDNESAARAHMLSLQHLRDTKPGQYKSFGAQ